MESIRLNNQPYNDVQGTVLSQNNWLRSWSNDLYLWSDEIVDRDPANYTTTGLLRPSQDDGEDGIG